MAKSSNTTSAPRFQVAVVVTNATWSRFKAMAVKDGVSAAARLGEMIAAFVTPTRKAGATNVAPEKRVGRDGRARFSPGFAVLDLPSGTCCHALVGQRKGEPLFCGEKVEPGSNWCAAHRKAMTGAVRPRRPDPPVVV